VTKNEIKKYFEDTVIPHIHSETEEVEQTTSQYHEIESFISNVIEVLENKKMPKVSLNL